MSQEKELSSEALGHAVSSILADPAFGRLLSELRGEGGEAAASAEPAVPAVTPQMLEKLPQMMAALRPLVEGGEKSGQKLHRFHDVKLGRIRVAGIGAET